jgi:hypothetical protein
MKQEKLINLILFFFLACVIVIASTGGFSSESLLSTIMFNIGLSMLGGIVCGSFFYGINIFKKERPIGSEHFVCFNRNQDMGQKYWIDFIKKIERDSNPLWFVGNRHGTWIDKGYAYRKEVKKSFIQRINYAIQSPSAAGWEVIILLTDTAAIKKWKEFIIEEIVNTTNYCDKRPELIKIGYINGDIVPYSIVAHGKGLVITTYTSRGRAADSPTFEVKPDSGVANLYIDDLKRIEEKVEESYWWDCTK